MEEAFNNVDNLEIEETGETPKPKRAIRWTIIIPIILIAIIILIVVLIMVLKKKVG